MGLRQPRPADRVRTGKAACRGAAAGRLGLPCRAALPHRPSASTAQPLSTHTARSAAALPPHTTPSSRGSRSTPGPAPGPAPGPTRARTPRSPRAAAPSASSSTPAPAPSPSAPTSLTPESIDALKPSQLARALLDRLRPRAPHPGPEHTALLAAAARRLAPHMHELDPAVLAELLTAYGGAYGGGNGGGGKGGRGGAPRDVLALAAAALAGKMDALPGPALVRAAEACAALGLPATPLLSAICGRLEDPAALSALPPPATAALLSSLSRLGHRAPGLYGAAAEALAAALAAQEEAQRALQRLTHGSGSSGTIQPGGGGGGGGSSCPGGCGILKLSELGEVLKAAEERRRAAAEGEEGAGAPDAAPAVVLGAGDAAAAVWAVAEAGEYHRELFDRAGQLLQARAASLDGEQLARVAWAYATVRPADEAHRGVWDRDLYDSLAGVCVEHGVSSFPPASLVTLLWSFASVPHFDAPLLDALGAAMARCLSPPPNDPDPRVSGAITDPRDIVAVAWSVQRLGRGDPGLMRSLGDAAMAAAMAGRLAGDDLVGVAAAFPATKAYHEAFFKHLITTACAQPTALSQGALLELVRLAGRLQHRDPAFYGPAISGLLDALHAAYLGAGAAE